MHARTNARNSIEEMVHFLPDGFSCIFLSLCQHYHRYELICTLHSFHPLRRSIVIPRINWRFRWPIVCCPYIPHCRMDQTDHFANYYPRRSQVVASLLAPLTKYFRIPGGSILVDHWWIWCPRGMQRRIIRKSHIPLSSNCDIIPVHVLVCNASPCFQNQWYVLQARRCRWRWQITLWFLVP